MEALSKVVELVILEMARLSLELSLFARCEWSYGTTAHVAAAIDGIETTNKRRMRRILHNWISVQIAQPAVLN